MIRYHKRPEGGLYVSTRRRLRGYVIRVTQIVKVYRGSRYDASVDWEQVEGWKAVGLHGFTNRVIYRTKYEVVEALVTNHNFWIGHSSPGFYPLVLVMSVNSNNPVIISPST